MTEKEFKNIVDHQVKTGLRIGANPWCCDEEVQMISYRILNQHIKGKLKQESYEETQERIKSDN
jgi:hypothetical protein